MSELFPVPGQQVSFNFLKISNPHFIHRFEQSCEHEFRTHISDFKHPQKCCR